MAILLIAIVVILLNFVVLFMGAKSWKFFHTFLFFLVFAAAITFSIFSALTLKTRQAWLKIHHELSLQVEAKKKENKILKEGDKDKNKVGIDSFSVAELKAILERLTDGRSAIWTRNAVAEVNGTSLKVTIAPPEIEPEEGDQPPRAISKDMVLHVFQERTVDGNLIPHYYLGEFLVTEEGANVSLTPTMPLDSAQRALVAGILDASATVALYEIMPRDAHDEFKVSELDKKMYPDREEIGYLLDRKQLEIIFPKAYMNFQDKVRNGKTVATADERYEAFLQQYLNDGRLINEIQKQLKDFVATPQQTYVKVRFLKAHKFTVDGDNRNVKPLEILYFDGQGRAIRPDLRYGSEVEFNVNDIAIFDREKAQELMSGGDNAICTFLGNIYVRTLYDFSLYFRKTRQLSHDLDEQISKRQRDTNITLDNIRNTEQEIVLRQAKIAKLTADSKSFLVEGFAAAKIVEGLRAEHQKLRSKLSILYRSNLATAAEIAERQRKLQILIERKTVEAMANTK